MTSPNTKLRAVALPIGALSKRTGVNIETIRYYERIGPLPAPLRSAGHHRLFDDRHRQPLIFIRRARELGFSLDQVRVLLGLVRDHDLTCDEIKALTEQHIAEIRHKRRDLTKLERELSELAAQCHGDKGPDCPILYALGAKA